jgi:predicted AlkP superfamily phosphohydrolase/phosphomutase
MNQPKLMCCKVATIVLAVIALFAFASEGSARQASGKPKTIILGFDGADAELARQWMDDGSLPNLKRVSERGTFTPLGTANPAQSPVSWAVMETASNPGKTNVPDFVRRVFTNSKSGMPGPALAGVRKMMVDAADVERYVPLSGAEKTMMWVASERNRSKAIGLAAFAVLLVFFAIFRFALRVNAKLAVLLSAVLGGVGGFIVRNALQEIPPRFPVPVGEMEGERFWDVLANAGVKFTGLQVPAAFPAIAAPGARLLAGLFTPDVQGGPGAWAVFTNDEWAPSAPQSTETGGKVYKIWQDKDRKYRTRLDGPENFVMVDRFDRLLEAIGRLESELGISQQKKDELKDRREDVIAEREEWEAKNGGRKTSVEMVIEPDYATRKVKVTIDGETQEIAEGQWSKYYRITYAMTKFVKIQAIPRIYVQECFRDADDNERLRLFVPPISISPEEQPPVLPISAPRGFVAELAEEIELFDTIGWACWTNALKDQEIDERAFLTGLENTLEWRTKQLEHELAKDDWDVLFHVESVTDRAGHMFYRFIDPQHPFYDAKTKDGRFVRDLEFECYGRKFALKDAIKETYKEMDRIVGSIFDRIEQGRFGANATLMVISDHGFDSFRYGVNLNNWLQANGYMTIADETLATIQAGSVGELLGGSMLIDYPDWTQTKAYSLGLGKIYLNIKGREPLGIVDPADVPALKKARNRYSRRTTARRSIPASTRRSRATSSSASTLGIACRGRRRSAASKWTR